MTEPEAALDAPPPTSVATRVSRYASLVKLSHTIFGLPFTLASAILAHRFATAEAATAAATAVQTAAEATPETGDAVGMTWFKLIWIVVAFTGARTTAMGFNRIVDRKIDAANPRTASRELPAGVVSLGGAWAMTVIAAAVFVGASAALGPVALLFSPLCLVVVCGYSLFKRFSWAAHLILGVALALGPAGAWVAVTGGLAGFELPAVMMVAVATWVAGFDVIYSLQDYEYDKRAKLRSIPVAFGLRGALVISALLHVVTAAALVGVHLIAGLGPVHLAGMVLVLAILVYEHWIVRPSDLSRINKAFFDLNGYISIAYFAAMLVDVLWR
jgi:4-hydroxybenzoate polyprenyltransferase